MLLDADVEDEAWFAPSDASPAEIEEGLDADADELFVSEVVKVRITTSPQWARYSRG